MVIKQFAPSPALAPFIRAYEIIETREAVTRTLLPDTCVIIGFRYAGSATLLIRYDANGAVGDRNGGITTRPPLPNVCVTGLRTSVREMHTAADSGIILAKFRAAGAAPFFTRAAASPLRIDLSPGAIEPMVMTLGSTRSSTRRQMTNVSRRSSSSC